MYTTSFIALGIAATMVVGLVVGVGFLSLSVGALESLFGKARLKILKSENYNTGFAFGLLWNAAKEPARIDNVKVRLFNPNGKPTQLEVYRKFDTFSDSFATEIEMGQAYIELLGAQGMDTARVQVEVSSTLDGVAFQFEYPGSKFRNLLQSANKTVSDYHQEDKPASKSPIGIPARNFIADTVPGQGAQLAIATNPAFEAYFQNQGGGSGGQAQEAVAQENFAIAKVWIEPGCIVCNACEDIYPEVFDVQADNCVIRPTPPLDDGLRIEEAAEACPVEVIQFTKAG